ncbi:GH14929 [Drosophila grimshawi]|uniref:GH14929 n=1 Tax=Drosophila grimshawi TaxID=7222 RepID=B4J1P7_DROGR|nr:GH14929 [Drosophila grimshawi]
MYHFISERTAELRLSENVLIPSHATQYLKCFQLDAVRFLYERLSKQEFCIFNDESGLGKTATIVTLLNGLGASKKTLIVLQNDDQLLAGWQFHLGILSDLPVCILKDVNDSTESAHSVYLSKWSVLRSIGDLSKLKFDYVIVDHRGYMLNNNFCTSMLLQQYERKVNIVISTVDLTSDVKLLYNVLRLGGCLEHQHKSFRIFNLKFNLPDVKEVLNKRVDLEDYYKQRGVLGEYIKDFRLRRYRHQFESYLPLVTPEQYKINVSLWMGENISNSTISGSSVDPPSEARSTGSTGEIFECLMSIRRERELGQQQDAEKISLSEHSDEVVAMEPLIFEMSDSEAEADVNVPTQAKVSTTDVVVLSSDDCEIIATPSTPPQSSPKASTSPIAKTKRKYTKRVNAAKPTELTESENDEQPSSPSKIFARKLNVKINPKPMPEPNAQNVKQLSPEPRTPNHQKTLPITPKTEPRSKRAQEKSASVVLTPRVTRGMQRMTRSAESRHNSKYMTPHLVLGSTKRKRNIDSNQTPKTSKRRREPIVMQEEAAPTAKLESTAEPKIKKPRGRPPKKTKLSNGSTSLASNESKAVAPRILRGRPSKKTISKDPKSLPINSKSPIIQPAATPEIISPGSFLSDYSYMQCAQKLPENLAELGSMELPEFRVPLAPPATPLMTPLTLNFFSDSEVVVVPNGNQQQSDVVVIHSSLDESSDQSAKQSQSRRTRALKRKRSTPLKEQPQPSISSFGQLLAQQRAMANKSPDIFSNCSDLSQLTLAQPVPFEGFKIFGSEVKQQQQQQKQQHSKAQPGTMTKKKRERSCLDILEQIFETNRTQANESGVQLLPNVSSPKQVLTQRRFSLLDDDIFEITNNGEFGSRLRLTATGHVSPVLQPQRNKITNYLIGSSSTQEDAGQRTQCSQGLRKSPKSIKSTQSTKLTRWFGAATSSAGGAGESQSVPNTPVVPGKKSGCARIARSGGAGKRKRLDLYK